MCVGVGGVGRAAPHGEKEEERGGGGGIQSIVVLGKHVACSHIPSAACRRHDPRERLRACRAWLKRCAGLQTSNLFLFCFKACFV